jgi:hypothetical protein
VKRSPAEQLENDPMKTFATKKDADYVTAMQACLCDAFSRYDDPLIIVRNFAKYVPRQEITRFMGRYELMKLVAEVQGNIVECGVRDGQGVFTWAHFSSILEPVGGAFRKIFGFDTFDGFPSVDEKDNRSGAAELHWKPGDLKVSGYDELLRCAQLLNMNTLLPQFPKIELIRGDFLETGKKFINDNPHLLVSLLYLDFDLYAPTKEALTLFLPRMSKGAVIAFDEVNHPLWPGETLALLESMNLRDYALRKFNFEINMSYIVL